MEMIFSNNKLDARTNAHTYTHTPFILKKIHEIECIFTLHAFNEFVISAHINKIMSLGFISDRQNVPIVQHAHYIIHF